MGFSPVVTNSIATRDVSTPAPRFSNVAQIDNGNCKVGLALPDSFGAAEVVEVNLVAVFSEGSTNPFAGKSAPEVIAQAASLGVAPQAQAISNADAGKSFNFGVTINPEDLGKTLYLAAFIKDAS